MVGGGGRQGAVGWWSCGSSGSPRLLPATHPPQRLQRVKVAGGGALEKAWVWLLCVLWVRVGRGRAKGDPQGDEGEGGEQAWGWLRVSDLWLHTGENVGGPKAPASVYTRVTPRCGYP